MNLKIYKIFAARHCYSHFISVLITSYNIKKILKIYASVGAYLIIHWLTPQSM